MYMYSLSVQGECDPDFGGMFVFDIHAKELIVGEIFVRVYNEQPTFPLEVSTILYDVLNPEQFAARCGLKTFSSSPT